MKILVTGAAGFVGSHLAERLSGLGHTVVGLDAFNDYYARALKDLNASDVRAAGVEMLPFDLACDDLTPAVEGVEVVYHLAAQPGISATTPYSQYVRNNLDATYRLLEAVRKQPSLQCFVNIATSSIYGEHATDSEETPPKPTSYYGVTKLAAEQLALAYCRDQGYPPVRCASFRFMASASGPRNFTPNSSTRF
jgi:nucleoside-diphosphate-sugar epimerase